MPEAPAANAYAPPSLPLDPPASAKGRGARGPILVAGRAVDAYWWKAFASPQIDTLVAQSLRANPTVEAATAALRAARENTAAQRGAYWPSLDAQWQSTRARDSAVVSPALNSGASPYTLHTAQLNIAYTPDLFGANRRQVESAEAGEELAQAQLDAAFLSLSTNVVVAAITEVAAREQVQDTERAISASREQLRLVQAQFDRGEVPQAAVVAQRNLLAQALVALPPYRRQQAQAHDQLAALLGMAPDAEFDLPPSLDQVRLPGELPLSLPGQLAAQRPDIRVALAQLKAASAAIGIAQAARLPQLTLSADYGASAVRIADLLHADSLLWSVAAGISQPIFHGGALAHRQAAAQAQYDAALAQYRGTVIAAYQNVADSLQALRADGEALSASQDAAIQAGQALKIARRQHELGEVSALSTLPLEQAARQASVAAIQAQAGELTDAVALYQALGVVWWDAHAPRPQSPTH